MKKIIFIPLYLLQIFTISKSFKNNPIIGSRLLNILGLHLFRLMLSHTIMYLRMQILSFGVPSHLKKSYMQKGYMLIDNVVSAEMLHDIIEESKHDDAEIRQCIQGNTITQRIHLDGNNKNKTQTINDFLERKDIIKLFKFTAGKNHRPISHIQAIKNNYVQGADDPQKHLHSDTFHPTMKYWFFLQDVEHGMAPFTYVESSNRLTWKRLKWEYKKSISMDSESINYSKNGSFRIKEEELEALGLPLPKEVCVAKNTLVIVNTFGFHRRGEAKEKSTRFEIWGISRTNPFNPFIGFGFSFMHSFENWGLKKLRENADKKAEKHHKKSSWHVAKNRTFF